MSTDTTTLREQIDAVGKLLMGYVMDCQQRTVTPHALVGQAVALLSQIEVVELPALSGRGAPRRELDELIQQWRRRFKGPCGKAYRRCADELATLARLEAAASPQAPCLEGWHVGHCIDGVSRQRCVKCGMEWDFPAKQTEATPTDDLKSAAAGFSNRLWTWADTGHVAGPRDFDHHFETAMQFALQYLRPEAAPPLETEKP